VRGAVHARQLELSEVCSLLRTSASQRLERLLLLGGMCTSTQQFTNRVDLADLWQQLVDGRLTIIDAGCSSDRCYVRVRTAARTPLTPSQSEALERLLTGESQKELAYEKQLAVSTVCCRASEALEAIAGSRSSSRAPLLLVIAAHAVKGDPVELASFEVAALDEWFVSIRTPAWTPDFSLTVSEHAIAFLAMAGASYSEISQRRQRSPRTIANQLNAIFTKVGARGRSELRSKFVTQMLRAKGRGDATNPPLRLVHGEGTTPAGSHQGVPAAARLPRG
jgi:DNA-binding CsgD family transcriptional regulator